MRESEVVEAAVEQAERRPSWSLTLGDVDLSGVKIEKIDLSESAASGLPSEVTLLSGLTSSTATVTMSDRDSEDADLVGVLDLWHPLSQHPDAVSSNSLTNLPAALALGFDGEVLDQLPNGRVRSVEFSQGGGTVDVELSDGAVDLRAPVDLPAAGMMRRPTGQLVGGPINSSGVAAHVFNTVGRRVTPPPRQGCVFSAPNVGGLVPEKGWLQPIYYTGAPLPAEYDTLWADGRFGPIFDPPGTKVWAQYIGRSTAPVSITPGTYVQLECWADTRDPGAANLADSSFIARAQWQSVVGQYTNGPKVVDVMGITMSSAAASGNKVRLVFNHEENTYNTVGGYWNLRLWQSIVEVAVTPGWHHLAVAVVLPTFGNGAVQVQLRVDGLPVGLGLWAISDLLDPDNTSTTAAQPLPIAVNRGEGVEVVLLPGYSRPAQGLLVHVGAVNDLSWQPDPTSWQQDATVTLGTLDIGALPLVQQRPGWDLLADLASAEFGIVEFEQDGRPRFGPSETPNATTPARVLTTDLASQIAGARSIDSVRNVVTAAVQLRALENTVQLPLNPDFPSTNPQLTPIAWISPFSPKDDATEDERIRFKPLRDTVVEFTLPRPGVPLRHDIVFYPGSFPFGFGSSLPECFIAVCADLAGNVLLTDAQMAGLTGWIEVVSSTVIRLHVQNSLDVEVFGVWSQTAGNWQVSDDFTLTRGNPAVVLYGLMLSEDTEAPTTIAATDQASVDQIGSRPLELPDNVFWSFPRSVKTLCERLLARTRKLQPTYNDITVPGDPRVQCNDVVRIVDVTGRFRDAWAQVARIDRTLTTSGLSDTYALLALDPPEEVNG